MKTPGDPRPPVVTPAVGADGVVLHGGRVLLVQRGHAPFRGRWALPGGFVQVGESTASAVRREVREETGLRTRVVGLIGVYSDPRRDPRPHVISVAYLLRPWSAAGPPPPVRGGDDAARARWWGTGGLPPLAFDHGKIVAEALALAGHPASGASVRRPRRPRRPPRRGNSLSV